MKSVTINKIVKFVFFAAVLALFTMGTVLTASAQDDTNPVAIKYIGAIGDQPVFQVEFDNLNEEEILVVLKDSDGNMMYTEKFQGKRFSKRFQLSRNEDNLAVTLSLTNRKDRQTQQYQINRNLRTVEDVTVTRLR